MNTTTIKTNKNDLLIDQALSYALSKPTMFDLVELWQDAYNNKNSIECKYKKLFYFACQASIWKRNKQGFCKFLGLDSLETKTILDCVHSFNSYNPQDYEDNQIKHKEVINIISSAFFYHCDQCRVYGMRKNIDIADSVENDSLVIWLILKYFKVNKTLKISEKYDKTKIDRLFRI